MEIQYIIEAGDKPFLTKARDKRDGLYKKVLAGLECDIHPDKPTTITFINQMSRTGTNSFVGKEINACCPEFKALIESKL